MDACDSAHDHTEGYSLRRNLQLSDFRTARFQEDFYLPPLVRPVVLVPGDLSPSSLSDPSKNITGKSSAMVQTSWFSQNSSLVRVFLRRASSVRACSGIRPGRDAERLIRRSDAAHLDPPTLFAPECWLEASYSDRARIEGAFPGPLRLSARNCPG